MRTPDEAEIHEIAQQIQQLKIDTAERIRKLEVRIERVRSRVPNVPGVICSGSPPPGVTSGTVIVHAPTEEDAINFIIHQDRTGKEIHIGSKVKFLSSGAFDSTEGIVESSDHTWVKSRDYKGRLIKRVPRNLRVISRQ